MTPWQEYKAKLGLPMEALKAKLGETRPWDMLNPNAPRATEEKAKERIDECLKCDRLIPVTHQCKECGCFMNLKVKLELATCPLGKW